MLLKLPVASSSAHTDKPHNVTFYECGQMEPTRERPRAQNAVQEREATLMLYKRVIECAGEGDRWNVLMAS